MSTSLGLFDYIMKETEKILKNLEKAENSYLELYEEGFKIIKENLDKKFTAKEKPSENPGLVMRGLFEKEDVMAGMEINASVSIDNDIVKLGDYKDYIDYEIKSKDKIKNWLIGNFIINDPIIDIVEFNKNIESLGDILGIVNIKDLKLNVESENPSKVLMIVDKKVKSFKLKGIHTPNTLHILFKDNYVIPYKKILIAIETNNKDKEDIITLNVSLTNHPALKTIAVTLI